MQRNRGLVLSGAATLLVLGLAACGGPAEEEAPVVAAPVTEPTDDYLLDPKAPRAGDDMDDGLLD